MVLTADCDIANDKFGDYFSILPIISASEFLKTVWLRRRLEAGRERSFRIVHETIKTALRRKLSAEPILDEVTLNSLLEAYSDIEIARRFGLEKDKNFAQALAIVRAPSDGKADSFASTASRLFKNPRAEVLNALGQLGAEYFYFNYLPDSVRIGNIILLRQMTVIDRGKLAPGELEFKTNLIPDGAYRIGRFRPEFKHAIAQAFAQLFSRVGLPVEFEVECEHACALLAEEVLL